MIKNKVLELCRRIDLSRFMIYTCVNDFVFHINIHVHVFHYMYQFHLPCRDYTLNMWHGCQSLVGCPALYRMHA